MLIGRGQESPWRRRTPSWLRFWAELLVALVAGVSVFAARLASVDTTCKWIVMILIVIFVGLFLILRTDWKRI